MRGAGRLANTAVVHATEDSAAGEVALLLSPDSGSEISARRRSSYPWRLLHKAVSEKALHARGSGHQSGCARRRRDGPPVRDGRDGPFRSPPLETIQWA